MKKVTWGPIITHTIQDYRSTEVEQSFNYHKHYIDFCDELSACFAPPESSSAYLQRCLENKYHILQEKTISKFTSKILPASELHRYALYLPNIWLYEVGYLFPKNYETSTSFTYIDDKYIVVHCTTGALRISWRILEELGSKLLTSLRLKYSDRFTTPVCGVIVMEEGITRDDVVEALDLVGVGSVIHGNEKFDRIGRVLMIQCLCDGFKPGLWKVLEGVKEDKAVVEMEKGFQFMHINISNEEDTALV